MELVALGLLVLGVALAEPASRRLAGARWPERDPVGRAAALAGHRAGGRPRAARRRSWSTGSPRWASPLPASATALGDARRRSAARRAGCATGGRAAARRWRWRPVCSACSPRSTLRTLRVRARHRDLLDLLGTPWPAAPGARVLDHPVPVAYCLPGLRSRLVVSGGRPGLPRRRPGVGRARPRARPPAGTPRPRRAAVRGVGGDGAVRPRDGVRAAGRRHADRDARRRRRRTPGEPRRAVGGAPSRWGARRPPRR